jgi:hypothetical protein
VQFEDAAAIHAPRHGEPGFAVAAGRSTNPADAKRRARGFRREAGRARRRILEMAAGLFEMAASCWIVALKQAAQVVVAHGQIEVES